MNHVLDEMKLLRPLLSAGDYLIVEDSTLNGHPVLPGWGPGPYEAIEAYEHEFPNDYTHDVARENKFGWTFAPNGFLIRTYLARNSPRPQLRPATFTSGRFGALTLEIRRDTRAASG
jgi:hypothetical protein